MHSKSEKNEQTGGLHEQTPPPRWVFDNLIDDDTRREVGDFYQALESSKECRTMVVGFTPPRD
jgi:hypothetical protein